MGFEHGHVCLPSRDFSGDAQGANVDSGIYLLLREEDESKSSPICTWTLSWKGATFRQQMPVTTDRLKTLPDAALGSYRMSQHHYPLSRLFDESIAGQGTNVGQLMMGDMSQGTCFFRSLGS